MLVEKETFVPAVQELVGGLLPDTSVQNKHARRILLFGQSTVRDPERGIALQIPPACLPFILTKEILVKSPHQLEVLRASITFLEEFMRLVDQLEEQGREASYSALPLGACSAFQDAARTLAWRVVQIEYPDEAMLAEARITLMRTICHLSSLKLEDSAMQAERLAFDNAKAQYYAFFQEEFKDTDPEGTRPPEKLIAALDQRTRLSAER